MLRYFLFLKLVIFTGTLAFSQLNAGDSCRTHQESLDCFGALTNYSKYWKQDSLANSGFRELFASEYLVDCTRCFMGRKWSDVSNYFGEPNRVIKWSKYEKDEKFEFWYWLNSTGGSKDYPVHREARLVITIIEGVIASFSIVFTECG